MTGPSLTPIIIAVTVVPALALWLIMIFWADSHPVHGNSPAQPQPGEHAAALPDSDLRVPRQDWRSTEDLPATESEEARGRVAGDQAVPAQRGESIEEQSARHGDR